MADLETSSEGAPRPRQTNSASDRLSKPSRVGLYGGTFDPIHHGHLILARDAVEQLGLDRIVFLPAAISPHKLASNPTPASVRRDLVGAALKDEPGFILDDREIYRAGPSYTVETVEALKTELPGARFVYLIGEDHLPKLATWHRFEELRLMVEFVVLGRGSAFAGAGSFRTVERRLDISATEIRARVARGASIRYLVPDIVHQLILENHLYQGAPY